MRVNLSIGMALLAAAGLAAPAVYGQQARTRSIVTTGSSYLGIGVQDVDAERAKTLKLKDVRGAEVTSVYPDSPAAKAGLKEGDVVLEYNGQAVEGGEQLTRMVRETPIGRQTKIGIWRNGATQTVTATVEERKGVTTWTMPDVRIPMPTITIPDIEIPRFQMLYQSPRLGIIGESLGQQDQLAEFFGVKDGVLVKSVTRNSAAEKAGIKAGDVIVKVDDSKVNSTSEISSVLRDLRSKTAINVTVIRSKKEVVLPVTLDAVPGRAVKAGSVLVMPRYRPVVRFVQPKVVMPKFKVLQLFPQDRVI